MDMSRAVVCPNCKIRVLPNADGTCPSCQCNISQVEREQLAHSGDSVGNVVRKSSPDAALPKQGGEAEEHPHTSEKHSFERIFNDRQARKITRGLLIFQLVACFFALIFVLVKLSQVAFFISFVTLFALLGVLGWLYIRYRSFPVVKEKRNLTDRANGYRAQIDANDEDMRVSLQTRIRLHEDEENEVKSSLKDLQDRHIREGLANTKIADADIPGVGPKLKERLAMNGIVSAAHVTGAINNIPGFGAVKVQEMIGWRNHVFHNLDSSKPRELPAYHVERIKKKYEAHHELNDAQEKKAREDKDKYEKLLVALQPRLNHYAPVKFFSYLQNSLASKGVLASIIGVVLIVSQVCVGSGSTFSFLASLPTAAPTTGITTVSNPTELAINTNTASVEPTITETVAATIQATLADTATPQPTETPAPQYTEGPTVTPSNTPSPYLRVYFVDVGQGDATLILTPDGKTVLIDGGDLNTGIVDFLNGKGVRQIDLMIASHPHADHIGGLAQVLEAMPVSEVVTNGQASTTTVYERFLDDIEASQAEYVEVKRGDKITLGNLTFSVYSPATNTSSNFNGNSIVLKFTYGMTTFLFMGDADRNAELSILSAGLPVSANILKVGHHGSDAASSPTFLAQVKPNVAIYFAGQNNPYGLPNLETLEALADIKALIYGTDANGDISIRVDESQYWVYVERGEAWVPPVTPTPGGGGELFLEIVSVTSPVAPGANATLVARTLPGAACTITVYYKSGPSSAAGLIPKNADANGNVSWTWMVGTRTTPGTWSIVVTASLNGETVSASTSFVVAK